jgi:DNA polymerase-3 subunit epsilon
MSMISGGSRFHLSAGESIPLDDLIFDDAMGGDVSTDPLFPVSRRKLCRLALVAVETGARFQREQVPCDPVAWLSTPKAIFRGLVPMDACLDREHFLRATLLHGLSLGLDADPDAIDRLSGSPDAGLESPLAESGARNESQTEAGHFPELGSDIRLLRRLRLEEGTTGFGKPSATKVGLVVDVETTGTDVQSDVIIEFAARRFRYDDDGIITELGKGYSWLEDPGRPLSDEITRLTGIRYDDLFGKTIDTRLAYNLLKSADVVIAHNAAFDRKFVEGRFPDAAGGAWACSCKEIDWAGRGFDGRALGWLLGQHGFFHDRHRALGDVDAVIALLRHSNPEGRTALAELIATAATPGWIVRAVGAHFDVKDSLKARGYQWDSERTAWYRQISEDGRAAEEAWLAHNVYTPLARPRASGPDIQFIDWTKRYS